MARFQIFSTDRSYFAQLLAPDAADVLTFVRHLQLKEAEVERDGCYSFSVRLHSSGLWYIFQRDKLDTPIRRSANNAQ
jgi:hypothetical protein